MMMKQQLDSNKKERSNDSETKFELSMATTTHGFYYFKGWRKGDVYKRQMNMRAA